MQRRPIIGTVTQSQEAIPGDIPAVFIMGQRYIRVLTSVHAVPWVVPLIPDDEATLRAMYDRMDGLFLTGGVDVEPARYGETKSELCGRVDPARDATELTLLTWAIADHKPVLGVCRGLQVINVAAGGSLFQDVTAQQPDAIKHDYFPKPGCGFDRKTLVHDVRVDAQSRLGHILGAPTSPANSMHHQGVKRLGQGLRATAWAQDGLIEGLEGSNGQFLVAVQWHPEELVDTMPNMRRLFSVFAEECAKRPPA